jgi:hypothetical protein
LQNDEEIIVKSKDIAPCQSERRKNIATVLKL